MMAESKSFFLFRALDIVRRHGKQTAAALPGLGEATLPEFRYTPMGSH
jgi:hypothetical protein